MAEQTPRIVGVAIRDADGKVWSLPKPNRHFNLFGRYSELRTVEAGGILLTRNGQEQGFVLEDGSFVRRKPALVIATRNGQLIREPTAPQHGLFSEDVW